MKIPAGYNLNPKHLLGTGQTAEVYLAQHATFGAVALKLLKETAKVDKVLTRMFTNEVQITRRLKHPHIIGSFEGKPTEPGAFLALEYCKGGPLDVYLGRHGAPDSATAFRYILEVGAALQYSHDRQVLHRDIKPANVMLTETNETRLADFGTGTFASQPSSERVGTAFYMAPELFQGDASTVQSDIYSLGIMSYELLTGARPFNGATQDEVMVAHLHDVPRNPNHINPEISTRVASVVLRAMSRDPQRRFESVREYCKVLSQVSETQLISSTSEVERAPTVGRGSRAGSRPLPSRRPEPEPPTKPSKNDDDEKGVWGRLSGIFGRKS